MPAPLIAYIAALVVLMTCDFAWLSTVGSTLYRARIGDLLRPQPVLWAAASFYLVYAAGLTVFAVTPALRTLSWTRALAQGAFLGVIAYGTYDITNLATLRGWSGTVTALDIAWGAVLSGVAATASYLVACRMLA